MLLQGIPLPKRGFEKEAKQPLSVSGNEEPLEWRQDFHIAQAHMWREPVEVTWVGLRWELTSRALRVARRRFGRQIASVVTGCSAYLKCIINWLL